MYQSDRYLLISTEKRHMKQENKHKTENDNVKKRYPIYLYRQCIFIA